MSKGMAIVTMEGE